MSLKADEIYGYDAPNGFRISVMVAGEGAHSIYLGAGLSGMSALCPVRDEDVPTVARELLRGLHEAAGLPVPIVLDRVDKSVFSGRFHVRDRHYPGSVVVDATGPVTFEAARRYAAALAAAVERAESEPDPAEVERLAEVIHEAREHCGGAGEWDRQSARTILDRYDITERKPGAAS